MEHEAQPHQSDQHQLGEKETGDQGTTPSYRWRNEGIVPGLQTVGMSRKLEVHDLPVLSLPTEAWGCCAPHTPRACRSVQECSERVAPLLTVEESLQL
jgi:hypothetical protein